LEAVRWVRTCALDWAQTPLGPPESWSPTLKTMTRFMLVNRFPMLLWWGPQFCQLYNDAYRPILGAKHPQFLGRPTEECWSEIWDILRPLIETPFNGGPATWMEDIQLELNRYGFTEETHFTIAYSPVPDETVASGIGGVLATVHEISEKVVGERRIVVLRDLGTRAVEAKTAEEACAVAATTLARHPKDVPFALLYLIDDNAKQMRLAGVAGIDAQTSLSPLAINLESEQPWPLSTRLQSETAQTAAELASRFGADVPVGPWSDPPREAVVTLIRSNVAHQPAGLLIAGISSRLRLDDAYLSFIELAATQISTAIANARAYEEERKRAEALAEIDRAKIAFFSNVSHEFRTPLTLMIGPLQDILDEPFLPQDAHERLSLAHRNSLRLLKLVNTLLDFSRIEADRIEAVYEPVDLPALTAELASNFRSAIERAGLTFTVDCDPVSESVYVDREMWEKIVLNLLSNAFKFTLSGGIKLKLRQARRTVELLVSDTGTGIPAEALPRIFERFHRVKGARGRSYEGSGIGLALV
jgi:signal transduction histidine kinase